MWLFSPYFVRFVVYGCFTDHYCYLLTLKAGLFGRKKHETRHWNWINYKNESEMPIKSNKYLIHYINQRNSQTDLNFCDYTCDPSWEICPNSARRTGHRRMTSENNHDADQIYPVVRLYIQTLFINNFYVMYKKNWKPSL